MTVSLKNGKEAKIRLLNPDDSESLYNYVQLLSADSRSRFGPHLFDRQTIISICEQPANDMQRFVAVDDTSDLIVAYMLIKHGMIEADQQRYAKRNQIFDHSSTVTFAPSVADAWQSTGLGTAMNAQIEEVLRRGGVRHMVLWGGVQATNTKAVNFYKKNGYQFIASFRNDEKDNYDMIKEL